MKSGIMKENQQEKPDESPGGSPGEEAGLEPGAPADPPEKGFSDSAGGPAAEPAEGEGKGPDKPAKEKGRLPGARGVVEWAKTILTALLLVVVLRAFVVEAYVVKGASMEPAFHDAERLLINKLAPRFQDLQRGDVIVFQHPDQPGRRNYRVRPTSFQWEAPASGARPAVSLH